MVELVTASADASSDASEREVALLTQVSATQSQLEASVVSKAMTERELKKVQSQLQMVLAKAKEMQAAHKEELNALGKEEIGLEAVEQAYNEEVKRLQIAFGNEEEILRGELEQSHEELVEAFQEGLRLSTLLAQTEKDLDAKQKELGNALTALEAFGAAV